MLMFCQHLFPKIGRVKGRYNFFRKIHLESRRLESSPCQSSAAGLEQQLLAGRTQSMGAQPTGGPIQPLHCRISPARDLREGSDHLVCTLLVRGAEGQRGERPAVVRCECLSGASIDLTASWLLWRGLVSLYNLPVADDIFNCIGHIFWVQNCQ